MSWFIFSSVRLPRCSPRRVSSEWAASANDSFRAKPLRPVFEDVREAVLGQTELLVERSSLDLLALPSPVDDTGDGELTEDRDVAAVVLLEGAD